MAEERSVYVTSLGVPATGLTLTWEYLKQVSDGADVAVQPAFTEIGGGWYRFTADPGIDEQWAGVIDGGAGITHESERYIPVLLGDNDIRRYTVSVVTPQYDEPSDTLMFICFLLRNGEVVASTELDSVDVTVYDSAHVSQFTINGTSSQNGVFVVSQSTPGLSNGEVYYVVAEITVGSKVFTSVETILTLD